MSLTSLVYIFKIAVFYLFIADEGSVLEIAQYGTYYLPLNVFTASKGINLICFIISYESQMQTFYNIIKIFYAFEKNLTK